MLTHSEKKFTVLYSLIVLLELVSGASTDYSIMHYVCKPAIVLALLIFFWSHSKALNKSSRLLIISALLFSLFGDILLMFVNLGSHYFLFGLIAFLIAHIMYVIAFARGRNKSRNPIGFIVILLLYGCGLFYLLNSGLQKMLLPVMLYMMVILNMTIFAYLRQGRTVKISYQFVLLGAFLFMVSDSILALNKFYKPLAYSNITIMLTYALAQYFIVIGMLKSRDRSKAI